MNKVDRKIVKTAKWIQKEREKNTATYWKCDTFQKRKSVARALINSDSRRVNGILGHQLWDKLWKAADRLI